MYAPAASRTLSSERLPCNQKQTASGARVTQEAGTITSHIPVVAEVLCCIFVSGYVVKTLPMSNEVYHLI